ncbi:hypothetical protein GCM10025768_19150 [Microbacterium pseudoresistens]|uniref:Fe-S oxidoreductase n=1 Tax=Microbacterium pseudoresistens TaxID=640634 RepID=A0A7Y9EXC7_9MICO|nr:hypothetical protein [Microbacterium pseudoresistens]NYD55609.1 hypothetical protein [Microbacterium pseudoresistens]
MQLGTRWAAGTDAPASVPAALLPAIAEVEQKGLSGHWTLTWLEGRPIAELDAGWEVVQTASGEVVARELED